MASYYDHDAYESRPRSSRGNQSFPRNSNEYYLTPTAGASESRQRVGESQGPQKYYDQYGPSQRSSSRYRADSRYTYPPPPPQDTSRPLRQPPSPSRGRFTWPPRPTCEDEAVSLAKEAGTQKVVKDVGKDEARSRGSIDQEPIVQDAPEFINNHGRRYGAKTESDRGSSSNLPTPPTSEDEKARRARRKPSKLSMKFDDIPVVPEMGQRVASPYSYTASRPAKEQSSTSRLLSPDSKFGMPQTDPRSQRSPQLESRSAPTSPRHDPARRSPSSAQGDDYFSLSEGEDAVDDTGNDTSESVTKARDRQPKTYPPTPANITDLPKRSPRTSTVDFAPRLSVVPVRRLNLDARRNTDTSNTMPTLSRLNVDKSRRVTPLTASSALSQLDNSAMYLSPTTLQSAVEFPRARYESSYAPSTGVSPAGSIVETTTPPRSPRRSAGLSHEHNARGSPTSKEGSVSGSRPSSPSPLTPAAESPRLPKTDVDWAPVLAANAARKSSRLSAEYRPVSNSAVPQYDARQPGYRTDSLPYPVDAGPGPSAAYMPSERAHRYYPETRTSLQIPRAQESKTLSRCTSPVSGNSSFVSTVPARLKRPDFQARHSTTDVPQDDKERRQMSDRPRANESRRVSFNSSSQARKDLQLLAKKGLPPRCPRANPTAGYSEWYTISSAPILDICAGCVESVFERTPYRPLLRRSPPVSHTRKVQCAIGGRSWLRLAWLLTLQREKPDLKLLSDLAEIEDAGEECPGHNFAVRDWYGLRDSDGFFVPDFHVCYSDVKRIERLLPTLHSLFVPLPNRTSHSMHLCAIRPEGNRFPVYIDSLTAVHDKAVTTRRAPYISPFITLANRRQRMRDCTRDHMMKNGLWHFIPGIETLTVCADCFETVVEPEIQKTNDLAMRFNRTVQPVYGEGPGSSCQLYSWRMRKVFQRAIEDSDIRYLARKAKERREAELRLQVKALAAVRRAKRPARDDSESEDDRRRLDWEMRRITNEWQMEWE